MGGGGQDLEVIAAVHNWNNDDNRGSFGGICNTNLEHMVCNRVGGVGALSSPSFPSYSFWIFPQILSLVLSSPNDHT